jgi:hypothetical protein
MKRVRFIAALLLPLLLASCFKDPNFEPGSGSSESQPQPGRLPTQEVRNVMIMYSAGFNSLSSPLTVDLEELEKNFVPSASSRTDNILLVLSRRKIYDDSTPIAPVLYRIYKDREGTVIKDTLLQWDRKTQATDPALLEEVLQYAKNEFPANGYGIVYSSHASGWLPDPDRSTKGESVQSVGQDSDTGRVHETELYEFVDAIPYGLDYVLFDACFMACVEVAWALKDKTPIVGFSPTEIMSDGFNYSTLADRLIGSTEPDPLGVCQDYFAQYTDPKQRTPYATITLVDTRNLDALATQCKMLFEKYRTSIAALTSNQVQKYFRPGHNPWHEHLFDLRHMLVKAGITEAETAAFDKALNACILYERHTDYFMSLPLINVCGLSVFLPSSGNDSLKAFYKEHVAWNTETQLIK